MQGLLEFLKSLGAARIAAMGAVTIALVGFFAFLIMRVTAPQMTPLFTDLSLEDSATIAKELDREGVTYELRDDGNIIMVPSDRVARLRMTLAENGLPKGGGVGYEIFDKSDALGTTSFVQNINNLRALEGELSRTIRTLDRVEDARVHLVLPDRPLFSRDKIEPSASIVLKVRGTLDAAAGARHPPPRRHRGHRVAGRSAYRSSTSRASCSPTAPATTRPAATSAPTSGRPRSKSTCASRSKSIVSSVVGPGPFARAGQRRFRLQPHHPDLGQIRSRRPRRPLQPDPRGKLRHQRAAATTRSRSATNCPAPTQTTGAGADAGRATRAASRKKSSTTRFPKPPRPKSSKAAASTGSRSPSWSTALTPRTTRATSPISRAARRSSIRSRALVRSAIGFDQKRGDQVEVVNLRFAETPANADRRADRLAVGVPVHQGRHHARHRNGGDGRARAGRAAAGGAAAGAPHHHARKSAAAAPLPLARRRRARPCRRRCRRPRSPPKAPIRPRRGAERRPPR